MLDARPPPPPGPPPGPHHRRSILAGLIGAGIQASLTPAMHEREGARRGLNYVYRLIDLDQLGPDRAALSDILVAAADLGFDGLNITYPCKQTVIPHLDALSPEAAAIGAVNTVVLNGGRRVGHNTDWWGFARAFDAATAGTAGTVIGNVAKGTVLQLGAGGAGAAVAYALLRLGVERLGISDVDPVRAAALVARLAAGGHGGRAFVVDNTAEAAADADGIVNTTPVGMDKHPGTPIPVSCLKPAHWVAEIVYFPIETPLLHAARMCGCRTMDGGGMAVWQAVGAFSLFTGLRADPAAMRSDFLALLDGGVRP